MGNDQKLYVKNIFTNESKVGLACAAVQLLYFSEVKETSNISSHPHPLVVVLTGYIFVPVGFDNSEKNERNR